MRPRAAALLGAPPPRAASLALRAAVCVALAALLVGAFALDAARAAPTVRFDRALRGGVTATGNTLGLAGTASGPTTLDGIGVFLDATGTLQAPGWPLGTTRDWRLASSAAVLDLPAGATIVRAELVWAGTTEAAIAAALDSPVSLVTPSGLEHEVEPDPATATAANGTMAGAGAYARSADVTALVEGAGTYRVGAVPASLAGSDAAAGWTLYVVYDAPAERTRRVTLHTIFESVDGNGGSATVEASGLCVPTAANDRDSRLVLSALEADVTNTGDTVRLARTSNGLGDNGARITAAGSPLTNVLGGHITDEDGAIDTRGTAGDRNHGPSTAVAGARQGWDLMAFDLSQSLTPAWTTAFFRTQAGNDPHSLIAAGLAVPMLAAAIPAPASSLTVPPTASGGGTVSISVYLENQGDAAATALSFTLALPTGVTLAPATFTVDGAPVTNVTTASLAAGVALPDLPVGASHEVALTLELALAPELDAVLIAPRVTYESSGCAGVSVPGTYAPPAVTVVVHTCGDGDLSGAELCDDGDRAGGDGCSATCTPESGWSCAAAQGALGTPTSPDSVCSTLCGDGQIAVGAETCDDGNGAGRDGCSATCAVEYGWTCAGPVGTAGHCAATCGDGRRAQPVEACDDGDAQGGDGCTANCAIEEGFTCQHDAGPGSVADPDSTCASVCGDGDLAPGVEACDDGNTQGGDGCSASCTRESGWSCAPNPAGGGTPASPDSLCGATCGDGLVAVGRETCDDGDQDGGDGCSASCLVEYGYVCAGPAGTGAHCMASCGDGRRALPVEACDDGDVQGGDGCSADCEVEDGWGCEHAQGGAAPDSSCATRCGDGAIAAGVEACDDGDDEGGDGCSADCTIERGWSCEAAGVACAVIACGDGIRALPVEACDDGDTEAGDGCSATCTVEDGFACTHTADDGDVAPDSACESTCGDGRVAATEGCDDGGVDDGDGCSAGCEVEDGWGCEGAPSVCAAVCGDGRVVGAEACDDGGTLPTPSGDPDGCAAECGAIDHGWACDGAPSVCTTTCGDGLIGIGAEVCDDGNDVDGDGCAGDCAEVELGFSCGDPPAEPSVCQAPCGDGYRRLNEGCDDGNNEPGDGCSPDCRLERGWICAEADVDAPTICDRDRDEDGVLDDGDGSGVAGDAPCAEGETAGCDDNCPDYDNPAQTFPPEGESPLCPVYDGPRTRGGGGCAASSPELGLWWLLALLWLVLPRVRRKVLVLLGVAAGLEATAHAQEVDPRAFDAALSPAGVLGVETSATAPHLAPWVGLTAAYANDELVTRVSPNRVDRGPLKSRFITTLGLGVGLFDRLELALGVPLVSTTLGRGAIGDEGTGLGDLRLAARGRLFGPAHGGDGVGLALGLEATLPTGGAAFRTDGGATFTPRLTLDYRGYDGFAVALNLGYRVREGVVVDDLEIDDEWRLGLGLEVPVHLGFALIGEANLGVGTGDSAQDLDVISARETALEALGGLRWRSTDGWVATLAAGSGLTEGYGSPDFRVVMGLAFGASAPTRPPEPLVSAGLNEPHDPWRAPPPPLPPAPAELTKTTAEAFDALAAADPDPDADGIAVPADQCPGEPEDRDGYLDEDGCPEPDNDLDGIADAADKCPTDKEIINGNADDDGCPDEGAALVKQVGPVIEIADKIKFKSGSAELLPSDKLILDQVAGVLKAHTALGRVRIEGHTDNLGDREFNVDLAERRAWSVRAYLIELGVDETRLFPKGFGSTRPVASNATEKGRAQNRRVEFHVVKDGEPIDGVKR